jgi:hypothetical protein
MAGRYFGQYFSDPRLMVADPSMAVGTAVSDDPMSFARGLAYNVFDLAGAPVDLVNMAASPINKYFTGRPIESPVMGSDWLIEQYSKVAPSMKQTGSLAENTGRFIGGMLDPIVAVKVGNKILKGMEAFDVFADLKKWSETGERPKWKIERDDERGILKIRGSSASLDETAGGRGSAGAVPGERQVVEGASGTNLTDAEVKEILNDDKLNLAYRLADTYTQENFGVPYNRVDPKSVESSIVKQASIGRVYELAVLGDDEYKDLVFSAYKREMPDVVAASGAQNYDDLVQSSYEALARETRQQFDAMIPSDMTFTFHQGDLEYGTASDAFRDIAQNRNLNVFRGGDEHEYLKNVDPVTGLTENEMFRAVHDMFGHAGSGSSFQPKGEEVAFLSHSQMYSPLARLAMASETRGQNSWVNYGTANAELFKDVRAYDNEIKEIKDVARRLNQDPDMERIERLQRDKKELYKDLQFAEQSSVLLPPEYISPDFNDPYYVPPYLRDYNVSQREQKPFYGVHFGPEDISVVDPFYQGTGHRRGTESERIYRQDVTAPKRSYFYGPQEMGEVRPESFIVENRTPYMATGQSRALYEYGDPLNLGLLSAARYPNTNINRGDAQTNVFESLLPVYGYEGYTGYLGGQGGTPVSVMFEPTRVSPVDIENSPADFINKVLGGQ